MNLEQLRALTRAWLDDTAPPPLWSDEQIDLYLNEAIREACVRARLLLDSTTTSVCTIALVAGQAEYRLNPAVIVVRRAATTADPGKPLTRIRAADLDSIRPDWRTETGRPEYFVQDLHRGRFQLSPVPSEAGTLRLSVLRYPLELERLEDPDDEPAIDEQHHDALCHWVCFRALTQRDSEQNSANSASDHLNAFEAAFGPKPTARQLQRLAVDPGGSSASYFF